jgi:hypothetical protein
VDEVRAVRPGGRIGVLAESEVVKVVDQSAEDSGIVCGEVEGSRVCFLYDQCLLEYRVGL